MTVVLVARPPRPGAVLADFPDSTPLTAAEAADLAAAMLRDTAGAVAESSADLLVNYPPAEECAADDPETALREELDGVAPEARYEVQVGSSFSARAGNAVTHLLEDEGEGSAIVLRPDVPLLTRSAVDEALMRLRRDDVVLGPAREGRVSVAGFRAPIDFAGAFAAPAIRTLADRARDAGHGVGFLPVGVRVTAPGDLRTLLAYADARRSAGRAVPEHTLAWADEVGLRVDGGADGPRLARD